MKNLKKMYFIFFITVSFGWIYGQKDSVLFLPDKGEYKIEYKVNINEKDTILTVTFIPSTKINPIIRCKVKQNNLNKFLEYNYSIQNDIQSKQGIELFLLDINKDVYYSNSSVNNWFWGIDERLNGGCSWFDTTLIEPSYKKEGFKISSKCLPGLGNSYFQGQLPFYTFNEAEVSEFLYNSLDSLSGFPRNYILRKTIIPIQLLSGISNEELLDTLIYFNNCSPIYNWILTSQTKDKYASYLTNAKSSLQQNNFSAARSFLQNILRDVDIDSVSAITSEAYALLKYNTEYLLSKLPQPPIGIFAKLVNSSNIKLPGGSLQYYEGAWKDAVNNNDGTFTVPTTQKTVSLRMNYQFGSHQKNNITISADTVVFQTVNTQVELVNSSGAAIDTGKVQYYAGAWREFGNTNGGISTKELLPGSYAFRMSYAYASIDKTQDIGKDNLVVFQTVPTKIQLVNSNGSLIDTGRVQYYSGAWRNFGITSNGESVKELLPLNYSFRMNYAFASFDKQQNIGTNQTVVFQTVPVSVQLKNSNGNFITEPGTVQYYSGSWREFGITVNGISIKELLPNTYSFRINYAFASLDKQQNVGTNSSVIFQTAPVTVQLKNSNGNFIDQGTVQYYSGAWRNFGITSNGVSVKELLPNTYSFRMNYEYASKDKSQDVSKDNVVVFQTIPATAQLKNSTGNFINESCAVQYYSGAWRDLGTTANGIAVKELLPNSYSFRMNYAYASLDKTQDLTINNTVLFQTVAASVQLKNSSGILIDTGRVQYYSGAWRDLGITSGGIAVKELLPNSYTFRMSFAFASMDKTQNIGTNPAIVFQTIPVTVRLQNSTGNLIDQGSVQYYSGAWRLFGNTVNGSVMKELLPNTYSFRMTHEYISLDKTQNVNTNFTVTFNTVSARISVTDNLSQPVNNGVVSYYSGAWRQIGASVNGLITKELLPVNLTFRAALGMKQIDKTQNLTLNNNIELKLP